MWPPVALAETGSGEGRAFRSTRAPLFGATTEIWGGSMYFRVPGLPRVHLVPRLPVPAIAYGFSRFESEISPGGGIQKGFPHEKRTKDD